MFMVIFLIIIVLASFIYTNHSNRKEKKKLDNSQLRPPKPKNYGNYYNYLSDLQAYNDKAYAEFIEKCARGEAIFIEKEIIHPQHEKRMKDFDDLLN